MSEKKLVSRNVALALGIICIILVVVGLVGAVTYIIPMINDKNSMISSLNTQISQLTTNNTNLQLWLDGNKTQLNQTQTWLAGNITAYNSLQSTYNNYVIDHSYTNGEYQSLQNQITSLQNQVNDLTSQIQSKNAQITSLQSQIANLQAPNLIKVNLKSDDNHPIFGAEYLHVYGEMCNVGSNTAYNCKLHVVGYQSGGVIAFDTYIVSGAISGYSWTSVDGSITYNGGALTTWTITLQWTSS